MKLAHEMTHLHPSLMEKEQYMLLQLLLNRH
jgi:hypothetical protein